MTPDFFLEAYAVPKYVILIPNDSTRQLEHGLTDSGFFPEVFEGSVLRA